MKSSPYLRLWRTALRASDTTTLGMRMIGAPTGGEGIGTWQLVGGFAAAYLTGTLACRWMIRIVNRGKLTWFAVYCAAVGLLSIGFGIFH